jgi:hypothetical protein
LAGSVTDEQESRDAGREESADEGGAPIEHRCQECLVGVPEPFEAALERLLEVYQRVARRRFVIAAKHPGRLSSSRSGGIKLTGVPGPRGGFHAGGLSTPVPPSNLP